MILYLIVFLTNFSFGQTNPPASDSKSLSEKLSEGVDTSNRRDLTEEELMQKFFNKKGKPKEQENAKLSLPVYYENMSRSLAYIRSRGTEKITGVENIEVDANAIILILNQIVDKSWLPKLDTIKNDCELKLKEKSKETSTEKDNICFVPVSRFEDPDVKVVFIERSLEIRIRVIPSLRSKKIASLTNYSSFEEKITNEPAWFSTYINANLKQTIQSDNITYKNGREPISINFDSGTRFGELLIEASGHSTEKRQEAPISEPDFVRENVRGVLDFPSITSRFQIGDLSYPVRGYQAYRAMAGVSLFTQSSLKSSLLTNPGESYELNLVRPSKVAVYINDAIIQILDLPAGRHNVRDFPFTQGQNELRLEITDDFGRTEVQNYSILLNNQLLRPKEHEISYAIGLPSNDVEGVRNYDSTNGTVSLFHRYGFGRSLTLGASIQVDRYQMVSGLEILVALRSGYFLIEPAYSLNEGHPAGYAARFRYVLQDFYGIEKNTKFTSLEADVLSPDFAQLGTREVNNQTSLKLQTTHSRNVSKKTSLNVSLGYSFNRDTTVTAEDTYFISVGSGHHWMEGFSTNLNFRHTKAGAGIDDVSVLLVLVWAPPKEHQFVSVSSESATKITRADWTYQPSRGVGGMRSRINLIGESMSTGYGGGFDYTGNRYFASIGHQVKVRKADLNADPPITSGKSVHTTNINLGSALVFAGGNFGISRPIFDSFAMFVPLKNIKDENILINPQKDGTYYGETDWLGSAVSAELPSHAISSFILRQQTNKLGVSLPKDHFTLRPSYRSGYAIPIGTDATIYLKTKLELQDGAPASMISGQAIYIDDPSTEAVTVFTNRSGLLRSEGFRHGRYRIEFGGDEYEPVEFVIPESAPDEFEMPVIKLKESKK